MAITRSKTELNGDWHFSYSMSTPGKVLPSAEALQSAGLTLWPCDLPASLYMDLHRQGLVDDPRDISRLPDFAPYEYAHVWYVCMFQGVAIPKDAIAWLVFERIDCYAEVYLNGDHLGSTANALIPHRFPAKGLVTGENELVVHIRPSMAEARGYDYTPCVWAPDGHWERLYVRRPASTYGGAVSPRYLSPGLGRVSFEILPAENLGDSWLETWTVDPKGMHAVLHLHTNLQLARGARGDYEIGLEMRCGESLFADTRPTRFCAGRWEFMLSPPALWWPSGYGEPNLYDCRLTLLRDGQVVDEHIFRHGVRSVRARRGMALDAPERGHAPQIMVNGQNVFCQGVVWGPEPNGGNASIRRTGKLVDHACDLGCNLIRCWGGDGYASQELLDLCDQRGIMVWQDVALYRAVYPQSDALAGVLSDEVSVVTRRLREHASAVLYTGGSDLFRAKEWSGLAKLRGRDLAMPRQDPLSDAVQRAVAQNWPACPFWSDAPDHVPLQGRLRHVARWEGQDTIPLASCTDPTLLNQTADSERVGGVAPSFLMRTTSEWFGELDDSGTTLCLASQIAQAERLKERVEVARGEFHSHGLVWWHLADPCSLVSSSVLDHHLQPKLAYGYVKRAQQPVLLIAYRDDTHPLGLWASSHLGQDEHVQCWVTDVETDEVLLQGDATLPAHDTTLLGGIETIPGRQRCLLIEWRDSAGRLFRNHYLDGPRPFDLDKYRRWMALIDVK